MDSRDAHWSCEANLGEFCSSTVPTSAGGHSSLRIIICQLPSLVDVLVAVSLVELVVKVVNVLLLVVAVEVVVFVPDVVPDQNGNDGNSLLVQ